jgi:hypothetical protein
MEPPEPALVEGAVYEQDQGKPRCNLTAILEFVLSFFYLICDSWMCIKFWELNWYPSCIMTTFQSIFVTPLLEIGH